MTGSGGNRYKNKNLSLTNVFIIKLKAARIQIYRLIKEKHKKKISYMWYLLKKRKQSQAHRNRE